ncbi:hypothetical protein ACHAQH_009267 [Verticillium albo-atrum]
MAYNMNHLKAVGEGSASPSGDAPSETISNRPRRASSVPSPPKLLPRPYLNRSNSSTSSDHEDGEASSVQLPACDGQRQNVDSITKIFNGLKSDLEKMVKHCPNLKSHTVEGTKLDPIMVFVCLQAELSKLQSQFWGNRQMGRSNDVILWELERISHAIDKCLVHGRMYTRWEVAGRRTKEGIEEEFKQACDTLAKSFKHWN